MHQTYFYILRTYNIELSPDGPSIVKTNKSYCFTFPKHYLLKMGIGSRNWDTAFQNKNSDANLETEHEYKQVLGANLMLKNFIDSQCVLEI